MPLNVQLGESVKFQLIFIYIKVHEKQIDHIKKCIFYVFWFYEYAPLKKFASQWPLLPQVVSKD